MTTPADNSESEFDFNSPIPDELAENIAAFGDHAMRRKLGASTHIPSGAAIALLNLNDAELTHVVLDNPTLPRRARAFAEKHVKQARGFGMYRRNRKEGGARAA